PCDDEDIAHCTLDHEPVLIQHQTFGKLSVPFGAREHLLEAIEMLDAREAGVMPKARLANGECDALRAVLGGMLAPGREYGDARGFAVGRRSVAALTLTAREDNLQHRALLPGAKPLRVIA